MFAVSPERVALGLRTPFLTSLNPRPLVDSLFNHPIPKMDFSLPASVFTKATKAANAIKSALPAELRGPALAIVCGSGLGLLQHGLQASPKVELTYDELPHFPKSTGRTLG